MDASVGFLLGNLKQLISYHHHLISGAEKEFDKLTDDLGELKDILEQASKRLKKDDLFKRWERRVREVVYDAEDIIDTCIAHRAIKSMARFKLTARSIGLAESVKQIRDEQVKPLLEKAKVEFASLPETDVPDSSVQEARAVRQKRTQHIVGFHEEANEFIDFLNEESDKLKVASIVGMADLGKTTLAWKIFEDKRTKFEFPTRIWVNVSELFNMKNVLLTILTKLNDTSTNVSREDLKQASTEESEEELIQAVKDKLGKGKFILIIDDIWNSDQWNKIKDVLPWNNRAGRVIITTRQTDVAVIAVDDSTTTPHYLRFLTPSESWELLQLEVYGALTRVAQELVNVGRVIATACDGLPLSIVVIGGILLEKNSKSANNVIAKKTEWLNVSTSLKPYLVGGDRKQLLESIISLSYEKLPYELKNCFLYLGVFPEDADIPVKKLIRLWIAEGFIQESPGKSFEEIAYTNLKELINRNLVMVRKAKPDGEAKVCHIHDSVRQICNTEAQFDNLNLFQEIKKIQGKFEPHDKIRKCRRLCIHSYAVDFFSNKPDLLKARSFLNFAESSMIVEAKDMTSVTDGFGILRVYDAKNLKFKRFPHKLFELLHLRYLTLVVANDQFKILPVVISDLWNLQSLILDISSPLIEFKVDIWKMRQLRHIKTKATITLKKDSKVDSRGNLQTLSRLSPESCTAEFFNRAKNLKTLGIQGDLNTLGDCKGLENLEHLNKLKLVYKVTNAVASEKPLQSLPDSKNFPSNLKILVVCGTYLDWWKMSTLSSLNFLEVLKLKEYAFRGHTWEATGGGFLHLVRLHIDRAELITWTANGNPFPELRYLFINNCEKLLEVPSIICKNLELLSMERVTESAVSCADEIEKQKQGTTFKLDIAPADRKAKT